MIFVFSLSCDECLLSFEGGPGYTLYTAYSGVVLVAGGSGISYATSVLDDILQKHASGKSNVRVIEVVWSVTDPGKQKAGSFFPPRRANSFTRLLLLASSGAPPAHAPATISAHRALPPLLRALDSHVPSPATRTANDPAAGHAPPRGPPRH